MVLIITKHAHFSAKKGVICNKMVGKTYKTLSASCRAHLHGSRTTFAILVDFACNTRGLCLQYSWALLAILVGFACKTRQDCLLHRLTIDVVRLKLVFTEPK